MAKKSKPTDWVAHAKSFAGKVTAATPGAPTSLVKHSVKWGTTEKGKEAKDGQ